MSKPCISLGSRIWKDIEALQGYAFLGDEIVDLPDQDALRRAMAAIIWHRQCVKQLEQIIVEATAASSNSEGE